MLLCRSHWHFAMERDPFGEARLVRFSGTPDAHPAPENEAAAATPDKAQPSPQVEENITHTSGKARVQIKDAISGPSGDPTEQVPDQAKAQNELTKRESVRKRFRDAIEAAQKNVLSLKEMKMRMDDEKIRAVIEKDGTPGVQKRWADDIKALNREEFNTAQELQFAEALEKFWDGELPPEKFLAEQWEYMSNLPYGFAELGSTIHGGGTIALPREEQGKRESEWFTKNASDRITIVDGMLRNIQSDEWVGRIMTHYGKIEKLLKKEGQWVESIENQVNEKIIEDKMPSRDGILGKIKSIRWYSLNNYVHGVQKYWAALQSTLEQRAERYDADIARQVGSAMQYFNFWPVYGEEVDRILDQQLDAKSNEETEALKKQLENNHAKWEDLFGEGQEFWKWQDNNPNKARAVLEYAAEHGFLYDIDENLDNHDHPIYGIKMADICSDWKQNGDNEKIAHYFTSLRGKNSSGREHEMDHGYKMEFDVENVPRFISLVEHEMDEHNLWAAAGVCKRAMERGLEGEVAAWLFTTIMQKLKQHPNLRKNTPVAFFDIIGKLSMYNTAFTLGWAKAYRKQLRRWAITGDDEILEKTDLKYMNVIERDIQAKDPDTNYQTGSGRKKMNHIMARVLAGKIVELPGGCIHIFESRFKGYRESVKGWFAAVADPHKEDPDFAREVTEKSMLPEVVFKKILAYTSTREFKSEDWVQPFLGSLVLLAEDLRKIPELKDAHTNYCDEIREKMDLHFNSFKTDAAASKQLYTIDPRTNKPSIASLVAENLLSWSVIKDAKYSVELAAQLKKFFPQFYQEVVIPNPPKPAGGAEKPKSAD